MSAGPLPLNCESFESILSSYLENELSAAERERMDAHAAACEQCAALLADVKFIVHEAAVLPLLSPSRDLWSGIALRLDSPVASLEEHRERTTMTRLKRTFTVRQVAAAALALATVSSGATYLATRNSAVIVAPVIASTGATTSPLTAGDANSTQVAIVPASYSSGSAERVYEREITAMRRIVDERLGDLDSTTVVEIERNLDIIDKAISDSRRALANDPRSGFLSTQLDRALEAKLSTLRRVALL